MPISRCILFLCGSDVVTDLGFQDSNCSLTCRVLMYEKAVELGIPFPSKMYWYTDSGSDEVSRLNIAFGAMEVAAGIRAEFNHGRGK